MKSFLKFCAIIFVIAAASVILAPILYKNLPWEFKFERIFNRIFMIGTLGAVILFVRIRKSTLEKYGFLWDRQISLKYLLAGFVSGVLVLSGLAVVKIFLNQALWAPQSITFLILMSKIITLIATGLLIGVIEEFFFRGFIFDAFKNKFGWNLFLSLAVTNAFYALVHFVSHDKPFIGPKPDFGDSFSLLSAPFLSLMSFGDYWHEAFGLFIFGLILNFLVLQTKSLYPAIGLHAGCVFFVKLDGILVDFKEDNVYLYSSGKMYDGLYGWVALCLLAFILSKVLKYLNRTQQRV